MLSDSWSSSSSGGRHDLVEVIRRVRNRWRLRIAMRGVAILAGAGLGAFLVSSYGLEVFKFSATNSVRNVSNERAAAVVAAHAINSTTSMDMPLKQSPSLVVLTYLTNIYYRTVSEI